MAHAIVAQNLSRTFEVGSRRRGTAATLHAVRDLNVTIPAGQRVAYIGPNGAGKSTSIRMFTGVLHPSSGTASVLGLTPWKDRQELALRIGTVFGQRSQLVPDLPVRSSFDYQRVLYGIDRADYDARLAELSEVFEAEAFMDSPARSISLGQRMRSELIATLLHRPEILFLDEPTIGLDLTGKRVLREYVARINQLEGVTVMLTSHDVSDIESLAERVIIIDGGAVVFDGTVQRLRREFLRIKRVDVSFVDAQAPPADVPGCDILAADEHSVQLRVHTEQRRLGEVLGDVVAHRTVDDMTITDPPLERVIGRIYARGSDAT